MTALRTQAAQLAVAPPPAPPAGRTAPLPTAGRTAPLISEQYRAAPAAPAAPAARAAPGARAAPARRAPVEAPPPQSVHWQLKSALTQHMHELHEVLTALDTDGSGEVSRELSLRRRCPPSNSRCPRRRRPTSRSSSPRSILTARARSTGAKCTCLRSRSRTRTSCEGASFGRTSAESLRQEGRDAARRHVDGDGGGDAAARGPLREPPARDGARLEWDVDGDSVVSKTEFRRGLSA